MVVLYLLPINAQHVQERYLPVFGEGITRFYIGLGNIDDGTGCSSYFAFFDCSKDKENNIYNSTALSSYGKYEISEDNSKLWGYIDLDGTRKDLLMDLNLNIGDKFKGHTVSKVYYKDERKHIEFEGKFYGNYMFVCIDENNSVSIDDVSFMFIEGFGPNAFVREGGTLQIPFNRWLYAKHMNGKFEYGIDGYPPTLGKHVNEVDSPDVSAYWYPCTCEKKTDIKEIGFRSLMLVPNPSGDTALVTLPQTISGEASLTISDLSGKVVENMSIQGYSFELNISHLIPATYIVNLTANDSKYVGKLIKK